MEKLESLLMICGKVVGSTLVGTELVNGHLETAIHLLNGLSWLLSEILIFTPEGPIHYENLNSSMLIIVLKWGYNGCGATVPDFLHLAFSQVLLATPLPPLRVNFTFSRAMPWQGTPELQLSLIASFDALVPLMFLNSTLLTSTADFCKNNKSAGQACSVRLNSYNHFYLRKIYLACFLQGVAESQ
jgi:hypothetical protein